MKKLISLLIATTVLVINSFAQQANALSDSVINRLKINVAGFKERYHSPSIVVLIVYDKDIVFSEALGYTDIENKVSATINSKYPVMSLTKTFTATMLMQLKQRGVLKLDDDVRKYLPEFQKEVTPDKQAITTLFQLATHTSGLPRNSPADIDFNKQIDRFVLIGSKDQFLLPATDVQLLNSLKYITYEYPKFQFLHYSDRHYSNLGYSTLGLAIQNAAKTKYEKYVTANIFHQLKMNNSGFITDALYNGTLSKGYIYHEATKSFEKTPYFRPNSAMYAGGMYTTATDIAKFISFQFQHNSPEADKVLNDENKAMMIALNIAWKPAYPFSTHEGAMLGYRSEIVFNPETKIGWVILTNTTNFEFDRINDVLGKLLLPIYGAKPAADLRCYTGKYTLAGRGETIEVSLKNDSLYSSYLSNILPPKALISTGYDRFKGNQKDNYYISYEFLRNESGNIKGFNMGQLMWVKQ